MHARINGMIEYPKVCYLDSLPSHWGHARPLLCSLHMWLLPSPSGTQERMLPKDVGKFPLFSSIRYGYCTSWSCSMCFWNKQGICKRKMQYRWELHSGSQIEEFCPRCPTAILDTHLSTHSVTLLKKTILASLTGTWQYCDRPHLSYFASQKVKYHKRMKDTRKAEKMRGKHH